MQLCNKWISEIRKCLAIVALLLFTLNLFAQQRKDEVMPKLGGPIKSIANLGGWAKDDIGKWYQFNSFQRGYEILRVEMATINYEGNSFLCMAIFDRSFYIRSGIKHTEYSSFFWLLDTTMKHEIAYSDTSVHTRVFENIVVSKVIGKILPVGWNDLLVELKKCFIGTSISKSSYKDKFFVKHRYDYKSKKAQFYIGSYIDMQAEVSPNETEPDNEHDFTQLGLSLPFGEGVCKDQNRNLDCIYFEIPKNIFSNFFKSIL